MKVYINGWSSYLPNAAVENEKMEDILGLVDSKKSKARRIVLKNNGIQKRHYALDPTTRLPTHTNSELCALAIKDLSEKFSIPVKDIDLLAAGTSLADQLMPAHASMIQGKIPELKAEVASLAGVCMASCMALKYAFANIKAGLAKNALVTGSEISSHHLRGENYSHFEKRSEEEINSKPEYCFEEDFLRWMLSDGAAALWLSNAPRENELSLEIDWVATRSYANELPPCMYFGIDADASDEKQSNWSQLTRKETNEKGLLRLAQDVKLLDKYIVEYTLKRALSEIRKEHGLLPGDVDHFIPHYSSNYFKDKVATALNEIDFTIPQEKWFTTLTERGNVGSASFFIYLCDFLAQKEVKDGEKILAFIPESSRFSSCFVLMTARKNS